MCVQDLNRLAMIQLRPSLNSLNTILLAHCLLAVSLMFSASPSGSIGATAAERHPLRVLIITGGHDFERSLFFAMFQAMPGIQWTEAVQPGANDLYAANE